MEAKTQHGYLLLADISGYTSYLAGVELDHAHEILTDLLETIVGCLKAMLTIVKLEGDAVFAYVPETRLPRGETLLELIESTYVRFCDRRDSSHRHTTCECRACQNIPSLDLKFVIHHGDYIVQQVSGIRELVGSDVNLTHRLLKNHISEATGWRAYALFTERGLDHMGVRPEDMHRQVESYEHLGEVMTCSLDLRARREVLCAARREVVRPEEADLILVREYPAPPPVVWEWINDPRKRTLWSGHAKWSAADRPGGRTGVGASNHCAHGRSLTVETVLDWRPFDYFSSRSEGDGLIMVETFYFEPAPGGASTRMRDVVRFLQTPFPLPRVLAVPLTSFVITKIMKYEECLDRIKGLIEEEQLRLQPEAAAAG